LQRGSKTPEPFLDADEIRAATIIRYVEIHDTLESTNNRAAELARSTEIELPALAVARIQTAGKCRGRNTWWAADGALTFSLLLDSSSTGVVPANWPQLSLATAVAVCDALTGCISERAGESRTQAGPDPTRRLQIKWPNDVLLSDRKICGILIESPGGAAPAKNRLIVGIGINVNNSWHEAPHNAGPNGIALCDLTGEKHDLRAVMVRVLNAFSDRILQLRCHDPELIRTWQRLNVLADQRVFVESDGRTIEGDCMEIAHDGAFVIDTLFGRQRLYSGSVRLA
jgi:BirA family biotin operon repressor/biotin-[acetyl-CoA-carboxylase] ligase